MSCVIARCRSVRSTRWTFQCRSSRWGKSARKCPPRLLFAPQARLRQSAARRSPGCSAATRPHPARARRSRSRSTRVGRRRAAPPPAAARRASGTGPPSATSGRAPAAASMTERPRGPGVAGGWALAARRMAAAAHFTDPASAPRRQALPASRARRARRTPGLRAASCWRGGSRRARRCRRLRRRRRAGQRRAAPLVGVDAAHHVVRRRPDRNRIAREVQPDARHISAIVGKPVPHVIGIEMRERQEHRRRRCAPPRARCCARRRRAARGRRRGDSAS